MADVDSTVWMGFMDIVPVIGSIKEAVELLLAVYEGNKAVAKEKEKTLLKILKEPIKTSSKLKRDYKPPAATGYSGLQNVIELGKGKIGEHVASGSRTKPMSPEERAKRVAVIKADVMRKLDSIGLTLNVEIKEELKRSMRGEHVINNGVLKFHSEVLEGFIEKNKINHLQKYKRETVEPLGNNHLSPQTETEIQTHMVVNFNEDEFYVNSNAVLYGQYCRELTEAYLTLMGNINPDDVPEDQKTRMNTLIDNMTNHQIYVDDMARDKWIRTDPARRQTDRQTRFTTVSGQVKGMYRNTFGVNWCERVMRAVLPFFDNTQ